MEPTIAIAVIKAAQGLIQSIAMSVQAAANGGQISPADLQKVKDAAASSDDAWDAAVEAARQRLSNG